MDPLVMLHANPNQVKRKTDFQFSTRNIMMNRTTAEPTRMAVKQLPFCSLILCLLRKYQMSTITPTITSNATATPLPIATTKHH